MWLSPVTVAGPEIEPVGRDEAKEYLRIDADNASLDNDVDRFIRASRGEAETLTGTRLITQTVTIAARGWPWLGMPSIGPIQSVSAINYLDTAGEEQLLAADQYELVGAGLHQALVPAIGVTWPQAASRPNAVTVTAIVGYGDAADDVPDEILFALFRSIRAKMDDREFDLAGALVNHRLWR